MEKNEDIFIKVVGAGSLKGAAEQIGSDPSTVSRKVAALEKRLGVKLLNRSTRNSSPTEAGKAYFEGIRRLRDEQVALEAEISGKIDKPSGLLRVTAPLDFGTRFIVPLLHQMLLESEDLKVELMLGSSYEDIVAQDIDVAIRIGKLPDSSLICKNLGDVSRVLVGSQEYLLKYGTPDTLSDLYGHEFIFYSQRQERQPIEFVLPDGKVQQLEVSGRFTVNSISALLDLVGAGLGLHVGPHWAFAEGLTSGRFIQVLPEYALKSYPLHALYISSFFVPAKTRRLLELLTELQLK